MTLTLSHSACEQFSQCPARYKLSRLDRVPQAPSEALVLGTAVHAAVEADGRAHIRGEKRLDLDALMVVASRSLHYRLGQDDPSGLLDGAVEGMHTRAEALLRLYVVGVQMYYQPAAVELSLTANLADAFDFTGRIDAVQRGPDGRLVILDWKTADKPWRGDKEHATDQASAYLWLAGQYDEGEKGPAPERVTFVVLSPQGVSFRPTTRTPGQLAAWCEGVKATAARIAEAKRTGDFPARTGPLCRFCSALGCCEPGQAWVRRDGRGAAGPVVGRDGEAVAL